MFPVLAGLPAPSAVLVASLLVLPILEPFGLTPLLLLSLMLLPLLLVPKPLVVLHSPPDPAAPVLSLRSAAAVLLVAVLLAEKPRASKQVAPRKAARGEESLKYLRSQTSTAKASLLLKWCPFPCALEPAIVRKG